MRCKCGGPIGCTACGEIISCWTNVKDALPDENQPVLMKVQDGFPLACWYQGEDSIIPGFFPPGTFTVRMHLNYWMPSPSED